MNPYILDSSLLEEFKQAVSDHDDFLITTYGDYRGKNLWNLICSSKDWLHVSVNGLPYIQMNHPNDDARSLNVLQLIMAFDLVVQAIEQLYRAFEIENPLNGDQSVFKQSVTDDIYFAHIRACFGAHAVALKSADGSPPPKKSEEKYFASWSSKTEGTGNYTVYLYSNKPGDEAIPFSLSFVKIHEYIVKRYSLLSNVIRVIDEKKRDFVKKQRQRKIKRSTDIVVQLQILLEENSARIGKETGYQYEIMRLIELFMAPQEFPAEEKDAVAKYLNLSKLLVDELFEALQNMTYAAEDENSQDADDLSHWHLLHPGSNKFKNVFYDISKVFEYLHNPNYNPSLVDHHINRLIEAEILPSYINRNTNKLDLQLLLLSNLTQ
ncbi:hypothetical protein [Cohnella phaseoli]|uniref:Uncharacterized protein n=1 Tax=Cohnella phaseoli TaxID=456490 RepID=A0A3D9JPW3_9BACL|nr:hypothetical protein [Cohnella phaseoli]RED76058.1 hypothetical protein DFP98_113118 [Cohnella phaseoli]